jgi:ABC-2 type transport system permease protein
VTSALAGTGLLSRIALRTGWRSAATWVLALVALYLVTGASIAALYDTPEKIATYSASVGESMIMLNGRVAGLDTLGGVMMNEFAFIASFAIPIMAVALTARSTRREEETGRTELLLSAGTGRLAPVTAALVVVAMIFVLLGLGIWAAALLISVDPIGGAFYAASLVATGWVYAAATAVLAQVVAHNRTLWAAGLALAGLTLVTRGIGDTNENWVSWTSPLGWHGLVRPFGDTSALPLVVAVVAAGSLAAAALWLSGRRDVGAGMVPARTGPATASRWRASELGGAVHQHLGALVGWTIGVVALMTMYGALMNVVVEAISSNPALADFLVESPALVDSLVQMLVVFVGILGAGFALQSLGGLRGEETSGRLELELAAGRSRWSWLALHAAVVAVGVVVVVVAGSAAFALSTSVALDDPDSMGRIVAAGTWQVPAVLVFVGLSVALFGGVPRMQTLAWALFAVAASVTFMGPTLQLTEAQMRLSPFGAVGSAPVGPVDTTGVVVLLVVTVVLLGAGLVGFRRRDVPRT